MDKVNIGELEDESALQKPLELLANLLKSVEKFGDGHLSAEVLHFKRSDGIDIFVVRGQTRDRMRSQLPGEE